MIINVICLERCSAFSVYFAFKFSRIHPFSSEKQRTPFMYLYALNNCSTQFNSRIQFNESIKFTANRSIGALCKLHKKLERFAEMSHCYSFAVMSFLFSI